MRKFKVGDIVRVVRTDFDGVDFGYIGVVSLVGLNLYEYEVSFDKTYDFTHTGQHTHGRFYRYYDEYQLELADCTYLSKGKVLSLVIDNSNNKVVTIRNQQI